MQTLTRLQPPLWSATGSNIMAVGGPKGGLYDLLRPRYSNRLHSKGVAVDRTAFFHFHCSQKLTFIDGRGRGGFTAVFLEECVIEFLSVKI